VYADERLLERAIDNVLRNAVQHGGADGEVRLAVRLETRRGDWVTDHVIVTVSDSGPGIPLAERERIFERFYRVDQSRSRRTGGSGLGLAIAREIIHLFDGTIHVVDGPTKGATIEIRLPGGRVDEAR
jgi:signal transduction histidine kinase